MKQFRVQVRTELYRTYSITIKENSKDEEEEMDQLIKELDEILKEDEWGENKQKSHHIDERFSQFGGFMSIEEQESDGTYKQILGEHYRR